MAIEDQARAKRIAALRKQKRLNQQAMAEHLKVSYRAYQTWESASRPVMPDWPNLEKLAAFHGVKVEDIIGETPDLEALLGRDGDSQLDRIEAELEAIQTTLSEFAAQLRDALQMPAPKTRKPASKSQSRKAQ